MSLAISIASLFNFGIILLPIFTQINKNQLERGVHKTFKYISMLTIPSLVGILIIARYFIYTIYGSEYLPATTPIYILAFVIIIAPFVALYTSLLEAKGKPKILSKFILISLALNILLNYGLIKYFLNFSQEYAIAGAAIATVVSRGFYLVAITKKSKPFIKEKINKSFIIKPLISSVIMALVLLFFISKVNMNWFFGLLVILIGAVVYFTVLFLIGGIEKEDINLVKQIFSTKFRGFTKNKNL